MACSYTGPALEIDTRARPLMLSATDSVSHPSTCTEGRMEECQTGYSRPAPAAAAAPRRGGGPKQLWGGGDAVGVRPPNVAITPYTISLRWWMTGGHIHTITYHNDLRLVSLLTADLNSGRFAQYGAPQSTVDEDGHWHDMYRLYYGETDLVYGSFRSNAVPDGAIITVVRTQIDWIYEPSTSSSSLPSLV